MPTYAKSTQTKAKLLKTTARLLRIQGFNATGLSQIITESGVPKGSLYHHYPEGKVALAAAAVAASNARIMHGLEQMVAASEHPLETLQMFCDYYIVQMAEGNFRKGCPIATVTLEAAAEHPEIQAATQAGFDAMTALFVEQLSKAGASPDQAEALATLAIASLEGALLMARAQRNTRPIELVRDSLSAQILAVTRPRLDEETFS